MSWLRLRFDVELNKIDEIECLLESLGALAVTISDAGNQAILEPAPGATPLWASSKMEALFELDTDVAAIRSALQVADIPLSSIDLSFLDDADWLNRWRQYAVQFCFGERLWIAPRDAPPPGALTLHLDPGLAFGTGSHPTTRLCLEWVASQDWEGLRVLDFGCGSGILGLAALRLGAAEVTAIDHDPQALLATRENAAYNGLLGERPLKEQLIVGTQQLLDSKTATFDVVIANILANPLIELAGLITDLTRVGGRIILSGLLADQVEAVQSAYPEMEFGPVALESDEQHAQWACLVATRQG